MEVLIKPIITEKSMRDAQNGCYTFIVDKKANKDAIRQAIKDQYKVKVKKVMTNNIKGTEVKFTRAGKNIRNLSYKKARIILEKGQKIAVFEEIGKEDK